MILYCIEKIVNIMSLLLLEIVVFFIIRITVFLCYQELIVKQYVLYEIILNKYFLKLLLFKVDHFPKLGLLSFRPICSAHNHFRD